MQRSFYYHLRVLGASYTAVLFIYANTGRKMGLIAEENYVLNKKPASMACCSVPIYGDGDASPNAKFTAMSRRAILNSNSAKL